MGKMADERSKWVIEKANTDKNIKPHCTFMMHPNYIYSKFLYETGDENWNEFHFFVARTGLDLAGRMPLSFSHFNVFATRFQKLLVNTE